MHNMQKVFAKKKSDPIKNMPKAINRIIHRRKHSKCQTEKTYSNSGNWEVKLKKKWNAVYYPPGRQQCTSDNIKCWQSGKALDILVFMVGMCLASAFWESNLRKLLKLKYAYPLTQQFHFITPSYRNKSIIFTKKRENTSSECPLTEGMIGYTLCVSELWNMMQLWETDRFCKGTPW